VAGVMAAGWTVTWIAGAGPGDVPRLATAAVDGRVLGFSAALAVLTTLAFGAAPAFQLSRAQTADRLKDGLRGSTGGPRAGRLRAAFVVTQLALAVVLTVSTGLLLEAFRVVGRADSGFAPDAVATGRVRLPVSKYPGAAERGAFFTQLVDRIASRAD